MTETNEVNQGEPNKQNESNTEIDLGLGISSDLDASGRISFKPGIQKGYLIKVERLDKERKKQAGVVDNVLAFTFTDFDGKAKHTHLEFAIPTDDAKFKTKLEGFNKRVKHIFEAFQPAPQKGLGVGSKNFVEYFDNIVRDFNTANNGNPIYKTGADYKLYVPVYLKLTYDKGNYLQLSFFPNFIERIKEGKETTLFIDVKTDKIEQTKGHTSGGMGEIGGGGVLPPSPDSFLV